MTAETLPRPPRPHDLAAAMVDPRLSWQARGVLAFARTRIDAELPLTLRAILGVTPTWTPDGAVEGAITELKAAGYTVTGGGAL